MKNDKFINYLKDRKVYIVSPHLDDAVLSAGMLLCKFKKYKNVTVINCFTKAHKGPYTLSAKKFLKDAGYNNGFAFFNKRLREDRDILSTLGVEIINFALEDALFRRKKQAKIYNKIIPELIHIYPTYRWHIVKSVSRKDYAINALKKLLKKYKEKNAYFFAPLGIGNHADHLIVRKVCEELFTNLILYSEFPYNIRLNNYGQAQKNQRIFELKENAKEKNRLIKSYKTQFGNLFPAGKIPNHKEVYFINKNLCKQ